MEGTDSVTADGIESEQPENRKRIDNSANHLPRNHPYLSNTTKPKSQPAQPNPTQRNPI